MSIMPPPSTLFLRCLNAIMTQWHRRIPDLRARYRPELYYMRGPGPKWHAKHPNDSASGAGWSGAMRRVDQHGA